MVSVSDANSFGCGSCPPPLFFNEIFDTYDRFLQHTGHLVSTYPFPIHNCSPEWIAKKEMRPRGSTAYLGLIQGLNLDQYLTHEINVLFPHEWPDTCCEASLGRSPDVEELEKSFGKKIIVFEEVKILLQRIGSNDGVPIDEDQFIKNIAGKHSDDIAVVFFQDDIESRLIFYENKEA
ncbi:hypothetical protein L1887_26093 [Cichorium endivia]|nr:hypothetical protein L1887_26093 [Cichorium endivia]